MSYRVLAVGRPEARTTLRLLDFHLRSCASTSSFGTATSLRNRSAVRAMESGGGFVFILDPFGRVEASAMNVHHVPDTSSPVRAL
jgi:hypothetical protein